MRWKEIGRGEEGSTLVITALGMVVILAFAGLAIDIGALRYAKHHLQSAADAAAVAGALEISACSGTSNCTALQNAAKSALTENGLSGSAILTNCSGTAGGGLTIMVNNPPCTNGTSDPNNGKTNYVEVVASATQPTYFGRVFGIKNLSISARAEAMQTPNPNCIFALDPTGGNAITVDLLSSMSSTCGIVDESSASNALSCNLLAAISAPQISVVGGVQSFLCSISPTPKTGVAVPSPADPLANLPKPSVPACGTSTSSPYHGSASQLSISGTAVLYPDKSYCGGIYLQPAANVTFMPGTYVLQSSGGPGGLTINLLSNVSGAGVTFYNYGPHGGITLLAPSITMGGVNLVAPSTGTYACILFFQDPQNSDGANIIGSPDWNTVLQGTYYFPSAKVSFVASLQIDYNILIAKDIEFLFLTFGSTNLSSSFYNNYSSISNGCPLSGGGSVLVQ